MESMSSEHIQAIAMEVHGMTLSRWSGKYIREPKSTSFQKNLEIFSSISKFLTEFSEIFTQFCVTYTSNLSHLTWQKSSLTYFCQALSYFFFNSHIITYFSGHSQKNSKHTFFSQSSHSLTKISKKASKKFPSFSCPNPVLIQSRDTKIT